MLRNLLSALAASFSFTAGLLLPVPVCAADFPPITDAERSLDAVPGSQGAPAVILLKRGHMEIMDYPRVVTSTLDVSVRLKVLTEEGTAFADVVVPHSNQLRLVAFRGRTIAPDGTVVPLPKDAVFVEAASRRDKIFQTKAAFPAVVVGSIIDYTYTMK